MILLWYSCRFRVASTVWNSKTLSTTVTLATSSPENARRSRYQVMFVWHACCCDNWLSYAEWWRCLLERSHFRAVERRPGRGRRVPGQQEELQAHQDLQEQREENLRAVQDGGQPGREGQRRGQVNLHVLQLHPPDFNCQNSEWKQW